MPTQPGRNDPCWCGSGKKYKNCHLQQDQQAIMDSAINLFKRPTSSKPDRSAADLAFEAEWEDFKRADLDGKIALFIEKLDNRSLESEDSFEMLLAIREAADVKHNADARVRFAALIDRLRRELPKVHQADQGYYLKALIEDAIADQHWAALPDLLNELAAQLPRKIDEFFDVVYAALYHGQTAPVLTAMQSAWRKVSRTADILPDGIDEYGGLIMQLMLYDHLARPATQRDADSTFMAALRAYGTPVTEWFEQALRHLAAPTPAAWRPEDFGATVDADRWTDNIKALWFDLMADQQRLAAVPYSKSNLARGELLGALHQQFASPAAPRHRAKGKTRRKAAPASPQGSPLIPRRQTLDRELGQQFSISPYAVGCAGVDFPHER